MVAPGCSKLVDEFPIPRPFYHGDFAEQCMADYDDNGWTDDTWINKD
jgi:hypothetical protein